MSAARRQPDRAVDPVAARVRIRYAKRGRMRFASHRDFARALERAVRLAGVPIAYSAGFTPHPRISYVGAAPTGAASEAEYAELALTRPVDGDRLVTALDAALPAGMDIVECVPVAAPGLPDRIDASEWLIELPGHSEEELDRAVRTFLARPEVIVSRLTKSGRRDVDVRAAVASMRLIEGVGGASGEPMDTTCAIVKVVVRHATPTVRPDDVLAALRAAADLSPEEPARATRLAQGRLDADGQLADPLAIDRAAIATDGSPAVGGT